MASEVGQSRYIHGTEPDEQARLRRLNRLQRNEAFVRFLRVAPGARVLEVGSGLGILAAEVAAAAADVRVVGVEILARSDRGGDEGGRAGVPTGRCPPPAVRGRQLRPGVRAIPARARGRSRARAAGDAACGPSRRQGGGHGERHQPGSFRSPCPSFDRVWTIFGELQRELGGDALIGRRLYRLFRSAGFAEIELSVQPEAHWQGSPGFAGWVENVIGNIAGARGALLAGARCTTAELEAAIAELSALIDDPEASAGFIWNRAMAVR